MSAQTPSRQWTGTITNSTITIVQADGVTQLSIVPTSGTVTLKGSALFLNNNAGTGAVASSPITLPLSTPFTYVTGNQSPMDGFTIDASGGACDIVLNM